MWFRIGWLSQTTPIPRSPDGNDNNGADDDYKDEVDQGAVQLLDVAAEADGVELSTVANISCFGQLVLPHPPAALQCNIMQCNYDDHGCGDDCDNEDAGSATPLSCIAMQHNA